MKLLKTVSELRVWRSAQKTLGMVPTMGALHEGHLNLIKTSLKEHNSTLLSIFVNPSQFAPNEDLNKYPRTLESDISKFQQCAANSNSELAVFCPSVEEMYPKGIDLRVSHQLGTFVEVLGISHTVEGAIRPQFFRGVATVVCKLLNAAQPTVAYFGQKDIQQTVVVKQMVRDLLMPTKIKVCETSRDANGLALSSRNVYMNDEERLKMSIIYRALQLPKLGQSREEIYSLVSSKILSEPLVDKIEYISLNSGEDFSDLQTAVNGSVVSLAVRLKNGLRLIDNVILR